MNLGLDKVDNWFSAHPYGCAADLKIEMNAADKISEESVTSEPTVNDEWKSCVWHYFYIEIILSSLQIVFAVSFHFQSKAKMFCCEILKKQTRRLAEGVDEWLVVGELSTFAELAVHSFFMFC